MGCLGKLGICLEVSWESCEIAGDRTRRQGTVQGELCVWYQFCHRTGEEERALIFPEKNDGNRALEGGNLLPWWEAENKCPHRRWSRVDPGPMEEAQEGKLLPV